LGCLKKYGGGRKRARINNVKPAYTGTNVTNYGYVMDLCKTLFRDVKFMPDVWEDYVEDVGDK
jgi:hypothetical protein